MLFFLGVQSCYIFKTAWNPPLTERGSCVNLISEPPKEDQMVASCLIYKSERKRVIIIFMRIRQFWKTHPLGETFFEKIKKFERFLGAMNRGKTASNLPTTTGIFFKRPRINPKSRVDTLYTLEKERVGT